MLNGKSHKLFPFLGPFTKPLFKNDFTCVRNIRLEWLRWTNQAHLCGSALKLFSCLHNLYSWSIWLLYPLLSQLRWRSFCTVQNYYYVNAYVPYLRQGALMGWGELRIQKEMSNWINIARGVTDIRVRHTWYLQMLRTTALFRPVKRAPKVHKFATK